MCLCCVFYVVQCDWCVELCYLDVGVVFELVVVVDVVEVFVVLVCVLGVLNLEVVCVVGDDGEGMVVGDVG